MSELIQKHDNHATIRWKLLTSASALALAAYVVSVDGAAAADTDRPLIWLELGGQMENVSGQGQVFAPDFIAANSTSPVLNPTTPIQAQRSPKFSFGEEGKISFEPEGSQWIFSAAIRYGRSSNVRHVDHQTNGLHNQSYYNGNPIGKILTQADFADTKAHHQESHAVLDFMAGKDVGLGIFGRESSSTLNFGVRFAQFESKASVDMRARPDLRFFYYPSAAAPTRVVLPYFHTYHATGHASRDFRGVGPSLSWNGSAPFVGNTQDGELTLDWGANAAILFGKQKARVGHHETAHYHSFFATFVLPQYAYVLTYNHATPIPDRSRSVTVPNVGGSVGLSWRAENFKVSMGYRADIFFGAMDTGIDVAKKSNATFNGPYASISIGLGD